MADAPAMVVHWSAPPGCPDAETVRRRALSLAGPGTSAEAVVEVRRASDADDLVQVSMRVRVGSSVGERALTAASCEAAAESVAAIAGARGDDASGPGSRGGPCPCGAEHRGLPRAFARSAAAPFNAPILERRAAPRRRRGARRRHASQARAGAIARASFAMGHWATGLFGALWLDQTGRLTSPCREGADFALWSVEAFGCYEVLHHRTLGVSPCFLVEVDRMTATGFELAPPRAPRPSGSASAPAYAAIGPEQRLAIALEVDGVVPRPGRGSASTDRPKDPSSPPRPLPRGPVRPGGPLLNTDFPGAGQCRSGRLERILSPPWSRLQSLPPRRRSAGFDQSMKTTSPSPGALPPPRRTGGGGRRRRSDVFLVVHRGSPTTTATPHSSTGCSGSSPASSPTTGARTHAGGRSTSSSGGPGRRGGHGLAGPGAQRRRRAGEALRLVVHLLDELDRESGKCSSSRSSRR